MTADETRYFRLRLEGRDYDVGVRELSPSLLEVELNGKRYQIGVESAAAIASEKRPQPAELVGAKQAPHATPAPGQVAAAPPSALPNPREITAPMPGVVLQIAVAPGETVEYGQTLCTLEAMKMKNAIRAPKTGIVREVLVKEGESVPYGALLFRLD